MVKNPCSQCGRPADSVHLLPWVIEAHVAVLACPEHDPGGYWFRISQWRGGPPDPVRAAELYTMRKHIIETKVTGEHAVKLIDELLTTAGASAVFGAPPAARPAAPRVYSAGQMFREMDHEPELTATLRRCAAKLKVEYDRQRPGADPEACWAEAEAAWALLADMQEAA